MNAHAYVSASASTLPSAPVENRVTTDNVGSNVITQLGYSWKYGDIQKGLP